MKKIIFILFINFFLISNSYSQNNIIEQSRQGKNVIFIRHALAPGNGDPENFNLNQCETQRNLSNDGIVQSKNIGLFFQKNSIPIDKVYSSEWCRCKDTAKYAFKRFNTLSALNSFYSGKFVKNKDKQIENLKNFIRNWSGKKNLILVTHYVVISEMINYAPSSGEIVIVDKNLNFIGSFLIE